tara:strand:- start:124 stop:369 length:246 start_codon:yes stop_codon:yes gene_type:complete
MQSELKLEVNALFNMKNKILIEHEELSKKLVCLDQQINLIVSKIIQLEKTRDVGGLIDYFKQYLMNFFDHQFIIESENYVI